MAVLNIWAEVLQVSAEQEIETKKAEEQEAEKTDDSSSNQY